MTSSSGTPSGSPTPEVRYAVTPTPTTAERWRQLLADVALYALAVGVAAMIGWTMLRLDSRSEELAAITRARYTPCPCVPPPPP